MMRSPEQRFRPAVTVTFFIILLSVPMMAFGAHAQSGSGASPANGCAVKSPLDGSCGFVVNPPPWAINFPSIDHQTEYFHNGTYGIVYLNSTTFTVLEPQDFGGRVTPAACVLTIPSGTTVLSQTSTTAVAKLPDGSVVTLAIPQYSFCNASIATASPSSSQSLYGFEARAEAFSCGSGCYISEFDSDYNVPSPPSNYVCGSPCAMPPYMWGRSYIFDVGTDQIVDGQINTVATCAPYGSGYRCAYSWNMTADYGYNGVGYQTPGTPVNVGDAMGNHPMNANDAQSNALMCGDVWDYTLGKEQSACIYMSSALVGIGIDFAGGYYSCANFPNSNLHYNDVLAYDQNGNGGGFNWDDAGSNSNCVSVSTPGGFANPQYAYFTFYP